MMKLKILMLKLLFSGSFFLSWTNVNAGTGGEKLYLQNCMVCHADDGSGAMPGIVNLQKNAGWAKEDEVKLLARLKQGIQTPGAGVSMPANGGNPNLNDKDLKEIIHYMRQAFLK